MNTITKVLIVLAAVCSMGCKSARNGSESREAASTTYQNPILAGFYPDPSICKVGSDYYLINSTFAYFPGIPVFHSKDLVHWQQIGNAIDRPDQLDFIGQRVSQGLFAPAISHHNGTFYIVCTHISRLGNFIITAKDPAGPWSNPVALPQVNGIDPSLFFDTDGKCYLVYNGDAPDNKPLYDGHRTIRIVPVDIDNLKVTGENTILVNGGTDLAKKPVWIEGPHIFKHNNFYYLIAAEGGTGDNHSEVVFRSNTVYGPYEPYKNNPILTQRDLDPKRANPITTAGHCDFVQAENGEWWSVFLACRPYEEGYFNIGRETFLAPVNWIDGWPEITKKGELIQHEYTAPTTKEKSKGEQLSGTFVDNEEFDKNKLDFSWLMLRNPKEQWHTIADGKLSIKLRPDQCHEAGNPSFLGKRQQHSYGYAKTALEFTAQSENEKAGLAVFQSEKNYYYFCKSVHNNKNVLQLIKYSTDHTEVIKEVALEPDASTVVLQIVSKGAYYSFYYAVGKGKPLLFADNVDAKYLSTKTAGGFVGCIYGLYATSQGIASTNVAVYDYLQLSNEDGVQN
ncbi:glycoside hydrolase family 43 protein [Flavobacterium subsaxonicum]|uniref:Xylan 1,4-beta-xylosidase n=1 Tax=Flavobacterium subsaxonicum WB 4.1-42 = DSM 21790 TaxID=1121898 RepID=A0A0A2N413_9FLAO|nr:glycoside hydrolase family 43 protein [Flavobacterium subsaxonicum]KGO95150.1 xylan 1,4-beta-xylosidase [Flavobacterium subsaxonicum WB 4.1-42 = DSM 21790]